MGFVFAPCTSANSWPQQLLLARNACWRSTPLAQCCRGSRQGKSSMYLVGTVMWGEQWGWHPSCCYYCTCSATAHFCSRGSPPGVGTVWVRCPGIVLFSEVSWSYKRLQPHPSLTYTQWAFKLASICAWRNQTVPVQGQIQLPEGPILPNLKKSLSLQNEINVWISVESDQYTFSHTIHKRAILL